MLFLFEYLVGQDGIGGPPFLWLRDELDVSEFDDAVLALIFEVADAPSGQRMLPRPWTGSSQRQQAGNNKDEPVDLNVLLAQVMADPLALVQNALQRAVDELERDGPLALDGDKAPDELLASALGNRLARMFVSEDSAEMASPRSKGRDRNFVDYEELIDRNGVLAAALGACDCWGQLVGCPVCDGIGGPGWVVPDERLFASYVRPALRAVTDLSGSPTAAECGPGNQRKEGDDDQQFARRS